jgi:hypothetical protein
MAEMSGPEGWARSVSSRRRPSGPPAWRRVRERASASARSAGGSGREKGLGRTPRTRIDEYRIMAWASV